MAQDNPFSKNKSLNLKGNLYLLDQPKVMGIINITPDSFYSGSRKSAEKEILEQAEKHLDEGADFLDIGGYSTRPGASDVNEKEEKKRVLPAIRSIINEFKNSVISVDTFRSGVAQEAINEGASIINDVSGGNLDKNMFTTVGKLKVPYILMHMRGTPQTMKKHANYDNVVIEVVKELKEKIDRLNQLGIVDVIVDPGFGFAKSIDHNFKMLKNLSQFHNLGFPLLVGVSRKSMIYKTLGISPEEALNGSTALHMLALNGGAHILRVHDVKEAKQAVKLYLSTYS